MWSNKTYSYLLIGISGFGTLSNYKCFKYIKKTFNTNLNVFNILAQDSLTTCLCTGLYFITNILSFAKEDLLTGKIGCVIRFVGIYLPIVLGPLSSLMVSMCRFLQLKYPSIASMKTKSINRMTKVVTLCVSLYYLGHLILDTYLDMKNYNFIEVCQGGQELPKDSSKV